MTPEDFLEQTASFWNTEEYNKALKDAQTISPDAWIKKYASSIMSNKDLAADFYNSKLMTTSKPLPQRLRISFGADGFNPDPTWKQQIYQSEYEDVPREEFERVLSKMKDLYDYEISEQEKRAGVARRTREVEGKLSKSRNEDESKNWNWLERALLSDYEKQRYINNPQTALFGSESPELGKAPETRWGSIGDLGAGVAGATADIVTAPLPIANIVTGPSIRASRDIIHKLTGSPYQKEWGDIGKNALTDYALAGTTQAFRNARRLSRGASNLAGKDSRAAFELWEEAKDIKQTLSKLKPVENSYEWAKSVKSLPNSTLKSDLLTTINDVANKGVDVTRARDIIKAYSRDTDEFFKQLYKQIPPGQLGNLTPQTTQGQIAASILQQPNPTSFLNRVLTTPKGGIGTNVLKGISYLDRGPVGAAIVESASNLTTPATSKPKFEDPEFESKKEMFKRLHAKDWLTFGKAFAPQKIEGDPAWEAYKEVTGEQ